jgi:murein DD-endopeptidase / murein LD-carboxypeptidase
MLDKQQAIAQRALAEVGTPYRLHGRMAGVSLDCVGLIALALGPHLKGQTIPSGYALRGNYQDDVCKFFQTLPLSKFAPDSAYLAGDIIAIAPSPQQMHLAICAGDGWVHAHAGLRRVVHSPVLGDPISCRWRLIGE